MAKGPVLRALEAWLNDKVAKQDVTVLRSIRDKLTFQDPVLMDIFANDMGIIPPYDTHTKHWLPTRSPSGPADWRAPWPPKTWWTKKQQPIEPITQAGLKWALTLNVDRACLPKPKRMLPYGIYWVCHHDTGRGTNWGLFKKRSQDYQVSVNLSDHESTHPGQGQITVLIMTPEEPPPPTTKLPVEEFMYLIRRDENNPTAPGEHVSVFPGQPPVPRNYPYTIHLVDIYGAP